MTTANPFDSFKWDILHDVVFEDLQGLWEPLWWLRGGGAVEGQSEEQRQEFAERALRQLYHDDLIFFFRARGTDLGAAAEDQDLRLGSDEVDDALSASWWRGRELPPSHPNIWWGPTPAGEAAVNNPPDQIRAIWHWPPQRS
jgi:hypothetical protein